MDDFERVFRNRTQTGCYLGKSRQDEDAYYRVFADEAWPNSPLKVWGEWIDFGRELTRGAASVLLRRRHRV